VISRFSRGVIAVAGKNREITREVDAAVEERVDGVALHFGDNLDVDAREALVKRGEERREPRVAGVARGADADDTVLVIREPRDVFFGGFDIREDAPRGREQSLAGRSERETAIDTQEERSAEAVFNLAQLMTERGLRDVQPFSRPREASLGRNRINKLKMSQFDVHEQCSCILSQL
jgi:hypothetical protein